MTSRWVGWTLLAISTVVGWACVLPAASNGDDGSTTTATASSSVSATGSGGAGGAGGSGSTTTATTTGIGGAGGAGGGAEGCSVPDMGSVVVTFDSDSDLQGFCRYGGSSYFDVTAGEVNIEPPGNTGWWTDASKTIPPWLTKRLGDGQEFAALTTVRVLATANGIYQVGGLVVRTGTFDLDAPTSTDPDEHWLKLEVGRIDTPNSFGMLAGIKRAGEQNAQWLHNEGTSGVSQAGLGICRIDGEILAYIDTTGPSFTDSFTMVVFDLNMHALDFDGEVEIGMTGGDWNGPDAEARFDVFAIQRVDLSTPSDCQQALTALGAGL